ncbi:hypothetical protein ASE01_08600 [Nocardioides sp. Root190]|uniref:FHA domain-containing protein n=1 Tax=Nocardioides sp. Root190 TaxID=1736488 RepID=UPI0006F3407D|nr:FHA domain-containing protein [Nocardioides sp. Root190]KRB78199.1 hypothetical protein ASE01_08600 [Nocardioides sp. Root190]
MPVTEQPGPGELTLVFTDIEGSTALAQGLGPRWPDVLRRHRETSRTVWRDFGGHEVDTAGDGFFLVFTDRADAVGAAVAAQRELSATPWPGGARVRVRIGLHHGAVSTYDGSYVGYEVHRAARIAAAAHGGQVLASLAAVAGLMSGAVGGEPGLAAVDLGLHPLKDIVVPERLFQLTAPGLASAFPPVRSLGGPDAASAAEVPSTVRSGVDVMPALLTMPDGQRIPLTSYGLRIGRTPDNDLVLADPAVSRHHCAISATNGGFVLTDLQSTHGTTVDAVLVTAPRLLADGEVLRVGDTDLAFTWPAR